MVSFVSYVLSFKDDDSALGDVARDIFADKDIKKSWGFPRLISHLMHLNANENIYGILKEARQQYLCDL
jgi:hypothetical protein